MDDHHLIVAPPGAVLIWNGSEWTYTFPPALGFTSIVESGIALNTSGSMSGLIYDGDGLSLEPGSTLYPVTPWADLSILFWYNYGLENIFVFREPIFITRVYSRHADDLIVLDHDGNELVHIDGPESNFYTDYTSGSPNVLVPAGEVTFRKLITEADAGGPMYAGTIQNDVPYLAELFDFATKYSADGISWDYWSSPLLAIEFDYLQGQGNRMSLPIGLSTLKFTLGGAKLHWEGTGLISFKTRVSSNGGSTWSEWQDIENDGVISGITDIMDLSNVFVQTLAMLIVQNSTGTLPHLTSISIEVFHAHASTHGESGGDELTHIGPTAPGSPVPGVIWWDTST